MRHDQNMIRQEVELGIRRPFVHTNQHDNVQTGSPIQAFKDTADRLESLLSPVTTGARVLSAPTREAKLASACLDFLVFLDCVTRMRSRRRARMNIGSFFDHAQLYTDNRGEGAAAR